MNFGKNETKVRNIFTSSKINRSIATYSHFIVYRHGIMYVIFYKKIVNIYKLTQNLHFQ